VTVMTIPSADLARSSTHSGGRRRPFARVADRIDAVLRPRQKGKSPEYRTDFIASAVERELKRRERRLGKKERK
jgi:hypothetical protein